MNLSVSDFCVYPDPADRGYAKPEGQWCSSRLTGVESSRRQSADITIMTSEGDRVTLSTTTDVQAGYLTYNSLGRTTSGLFGLQAGIITFEGSRDFQIQVEGNLSREELRDIRKTITQLDKIMQSVVSGDMDHALEQALKMEAFGSISSLEANMEYEKTISTGHTATREFTSTLPEQGTKDMQPFAPEDRVADHMMDVVGRSGIRKERLLKPLRKMFSNFYKEHGRPGTTEPSRLDRARRIESAFLKKMEAFREAPEQEWEKPQAPPTAEGPDPDSGS